jgi:hypothetical protein
VTSFRKMPGSITRERTSGGEDHAAAFVLIIPDMSVRNNGKVIVDRSESRRGECRIKGTVEWLLISPSTKNVRRHSGTDADGVRCAVAPCCRARSCVEGGTRRRPTGQIGREPTSLRNSSTIDTNNLHDVPPEQTCSTHH